MMKVNPISSKAGLKPILRVYAPMDSDVSVNDLFHTMQEEYWDFPVSLGTALVTCQTAAGKTFTETVAVDVVGIISVEIGYKLWLFRDGDECVDVTGGWEVFPRASWGYTLPTMGTSSMVFNGKQSARTKNIIPIQNYEKLCFHLVSGSTSNYLSFGLNNGTDFSSASTWWASPVYNTSVSDRTLDLFSIGGTAGNAALKDTASRVVMFFDGCSNIVVDGVWLE